MENLQFILIGVLTLASISLFLNFRKEKKRSLDYKNELEAVNGLTESQIYGRSKFSELGLMSAGITHEISNPLSIILGRVTQLQRKTEDPEILKGLEQIKANAERISKIIQSVREYIYRNESESDEFISVRELVDNVLVFFGQRLKNHGIEIRFKNIDKAYVSGHKGQFEQAILNLVSNSFDAVDKLPEKWIEISAQKTGDKVQIFVEDSGNGIPIDVQERMLDPFFTTKEGKGSGLGLSLVKGIAQKHGGDLKYIDAPHTTFMLELPKSSSLSYH